MSLFTTPDLYDAHLAHVQVADAGFCQFGGVSHLMGQAVTITCPNDNSLVGELLRTPGDGKVLVVDAGASRQFAFLGDQLAEHAIKNNWQGVVVNGCIRDIEIIQTLPLAVMALGSTPRKTDKRGLGEQVAAVSFASVTIEQGDWLYGDTNGLLISPNKLV